MRTERERILERMWFRAECRADAMQDAAEFEARVAARLAGVTDMFFGSRDYAIYQDCTRICPAFKFCAAPKFFGLYCAPYMLKWARLSVEEEMDGR